MPEIDPFQRAGRVHRPSARPRAERRARASPQAVSSIEVLIVLACLGLGALAAMRALRGSIEAIGRREAAAIMALEPLMALDSNPSSSVGLAAPPPPVAVEHKDEMPPESRSTFVCCSASK